MRLRVRLRKKLRGNRICALTMPASSLLPLLFLSDVGVMAFTVEVCPVLADPNGTKVLGTIVHFKYCSKMLCAWRE